MEEELAMEGKEAWRMEEGKEWTVEEGKDGVWNLRGKILKKPSKQKWMLTTETVFCEVPGIFLGADVQMEEWGGGWRCFLYTLTAYISQMCLHSNWEQAPRSMGCRQRAPCTSICHRHARVGGKKANPGSSRLP